MKLTQLLGVIALLASSAFYECVATGVGFEEQDITFREGRDRDLLFLQKDATPNDVLVRILLLEVSEFQAYRNRTGRVFSQEILDIIDAIEVPATAGSDFNSSNITLVFEADEVELSLEINGLIIFDDALNEDTEAFVMVLEVDSTSPEAIDGDNDALRFNILDNDELSIGFAFTAFDVNEGDGNLTNVFRITTSNGTISEQETTVNVTIFVDGSASSATPDVDFAPVNGAYSYILTIPPGQSFVYLDPIEIIDDLDVEGDEIFYIGLIAGPEAPVDFNRMLASVVIIDNDEPSFTFSPSPTMTPVMVGGDPHYSIKLPSGQLLCFSVHGEKNFPFNLISNNLLQMNAFFIEDAVRDEITWIGSLGVVVQQTHYKKSNATKIRFDAHDQMIYINNRVNLHAKKVEKITLANGTLTITEAVRKDAERNAEVEVDLVDAGLGFSVRFVKKRHLDMAWKRVDKQPTDSHGIIGQFMRQGVWIDQVSKLLYLPSLKPVPVMRSSVWHFMERESPDPDQKFCWQAMNPGYQGKRLIEGTYLDYLVDDVLSSDFKFKGE